MNGKIKILTAAVLAMLLIALTGCGGAKKTAASPSGGSGSSSVPGGGEGLPGDGGDNENPGDPADEGELPGDGDISDDGELSDDGAEEPVEEIEGATEAYASFAAREYQYRDVILKTATAGKFAAYFFRTDCPLENPTGGNASSGDCSLLIAPDGTKMLIDCTTSGSVAYVVDSLKRLGISKIDFFVNTHAHSDHIGGWEAILANFQIGQVIVSDSNAYTKNYDGYGYNFYQAAVKKKIPIKKVSRGDSFKFGPVEVLVMNPSAGRNAEQDYKDNNWNDESIALGFYWKNASFFFGGDIQTDVEYEIIDAYGDKAKFDVVKTNHHGIAQQNSQRWVNHIGAKIAVTEVNYMVDENIFLRYHYSGAKTFHCCLDGTVLVTTAGDGNYDVQVEHDRTEGNLFAILLNDLKNGHMRVSAKK